MKNIKKSFLFLILLCIILLFLILYISNIKYNYIIAMQTNNDIKSTSFFVFKNEKCILNFNNMNFETEEAYDSTIESLQNGEVSIVKDSKENRNIQFTLNTHLKESIQDVKDFLSNNWQIIEI